MGQQQLLLVILVTIIVGIATVVAINTFGSAADSANLDAVRQDVASIASAAQGYYMKPTMLGGGGNTYSGITFEKIANPGKVDDSDATIATNQNGTYKLEPSGSTITITASPSSAEDYSKGEVSSAKSYKAVVTGNNDVTITDFDGTVSEPDPNG